MTHVQVPPPEATQDWHLHDVDTLVKTHDVDPAMGLHAHQVHQRTLHYGANSLPTGQRRSLWALAAEQFKDFMVLILLAAAVISGFVGDLVDTVVILVIVVLNAGIGITQSWRADKALASLRRLAAAQAMVVRSGLAQPVPSHALVPGDIVLLEAGNQIPADLRLIEIAQLKIDESTLTGESVSVDKHAGVLHGKIHALGDRLNMAFKGTTATHGRGRGLVVATGMATELGKVAGMLDQASTRRTPLQMRLAAFGKRVALAVLAICAVIFSVGVLRGEPVLLMALTAISLAVAAIPEALPAVVTVLLALGARKMVEINALVRRLPSVETLGSVTCICSDKTGTLTQNRMQVECLVTGATPVLRPWKPESTPHDASATELLRAAALCNDASHTPQGSWQGDPTETALTEAALHIGLDKSGLDAASPRVHELPFDAQRKRMSTVHHTPSGLQMFTKGAPESLIACCSSVWSAEVGAEVPLAGTDWLVQAETLAGRGLRVLAIASSTLAQLPDAHDDAGIVESDLCLLGLVGLMDPPRPEAMAAVRECKAAGVRPLMITGDHPATALAIARQLGIAGKADRAVLTGTDLAELSDDALQALVGHTSVFARVDPAQKIRIVQALQANGAYVAMTGDGINDAPALKQADIGIAMGKGGTDVAREAASLVLLDDNFATIVKAVHEGRRIFDNIRKFVRYAMTGNSGEIWTLFLAPLLLLPIPLLPIHILWINLVTDGLPGLALAAEPAEPGVMQRPPRAPGESLFAHGMWQHILGIGLLLAGLCLGVQAWAIATGHAHWQSMVFTVLTLGQMAHVLAIRSETEPLWRIGLRSNRPLLGAVLLTFALQMATLYVPWLQPIFKTQALSLAELALCLAASAVVWLAVEIEKMWRRAHQPKPDDSALDSP